MIYRYTGFVHICDDCWKKYFTNPEREEFTIGIHHDTCIICKKNISKHMTDVSVFYLVFPPEKYGYLQ